MALFKTMIRNIITRSVTFPILVQLRNSSYRASPIITDKPDPQIKYEVTSDPEDWKYVERLLPPKLVPVPKLKSEYASDWRPQTKEALNLPYYVDRSRNHMQPVYMTTSYRGMRRLTFLRRVKGDVWTLENDLRTFLEDEFKKKMRIQVNEFAGYICIHGDYVNAVKYFLSEKGL